MLSFLRFFCEYFLRDEQKERLRAENYFRWADETSDDEKMV